ncbi:MAG: sulfatase/phosphatase domain-containing protein, partial [Acidobacteriota bacterium]
LEEMKAIGLEDRTIVVVTADHGEMLGDHGLLFKGGYMYDEVVHAPCVIRAPGRVPAGRRCNPLVEAIDLMPTLLELMGIQGSPRIQGRSLAPLMDGKSLASRPVHAEFSNIKMLRTRDWKLVHYLHAPYGELYNLREDPHELYNRFDDPGAAKARQEMESAMIDWLIDSEDPARKPLQAKKL